MVKGAFLGRKSWSGSLIQRACSKDSSLPLSQSCPWPLELNRNFLNLPLALQTLMSSSAATYWWARGCDNMGMRVQVEREFFEV
jgi:hypothetical protein